MQRFVIVLLAALALWGCGKSTAPQSDEQGAPPAAAALPGEAEVPVAEYNIGDVETAIELTTRLDPKTDPRSVNYQELKTVKGDIAMAKMAVSQPYPDAIWVRSIATDAHAFREGDAILVRQRLYLDTQKEPIAEQSFVWSGAEARHEPKVLTADIMKSLNPVPDSVLCHSEIEIYWFPNTDASTIDPDAEVEAPEPPVKKLSNPLRIDFYAG